MIAFHKKKGVLGWLIDLLSRRGGYQHTSIIFRDRRIFESHITPGVHFAGYANKLDGMTVYEVPCSRISEDIARCWAHFVEGRKYDTGGTVDLAAPWDGGFVRQSDDKYFCSELAVHVCQKAGLLKDLIPHRESPNSLEKVVRELGWPKIEQL